MHFNTLTLAAILAATASALAPTPTCYNHPGPLQRFEGYDVVSLEQCSQICQSQSMPIAGAMNGNECWCGKAIPAPENIVPGNSCDSPCVGTPGEMCGGPGYWSVWPIVVAPSSSSMIPTSSPSSAFRG